MPHIGCAQVLLGPKGLPAKGKAAEEAKQKLLEVCGEEGGRGVQGSGACRQGCGGCRGVGVWEVCRAVGCVGGGIPPGGACGAQPPRPASRPALRLGGPLPAIHKRLVPALSGPAASAAACIRASDARAPPPPPPPAAPPPAHAAIQMGDRRGGVIQLCAGRRPVPVHVPRLGRESARVTGSHTKQTEQRCSLHASRLRARGRPLPRGDDVRRAGAAWGAAAALCARGRGRRAPSPQRRGGVDRAGGMAPCRRCGCPPAALLACANNPSRSNARPPRPPACAPLAPALTPRARPRPRTPRARRSTT
jgi:hypothetical protein